MEVRVLYFASLRERLGVDAEAVELPAGVTTAGQLRSLLRERGGDWAEALAEHRAVRCAVDREMAGPQTGLAAGCEVAFFPPVTGG